MHMKSILGLCAWLGFLLSSTVQAASVEDIRTDHCSDCGKLMVGTAHINHSSVQWIGSSLPSSLTALSGNSAFGFTGPVAYQGDEVPGNVWQFELSSRVVIGGPKPSGQAPSIGFFFSPSLPTTFTSQLTYRGDVPLVKYLDVRGEGVADSDTNPAVTLEISVQGNASQTACPSEVHCDDLTVGIGGTTTFSITPRVNQAALPADIGQVQYVMVNLTAHEQDTLLAGSDFAFRDRSMANDFNPASYFHNLYPLGPTRMETAALRTYSFLVAVNRTFQFYSSNMRDSGDGYVEYLFSIPGHFNFNDESKYPGSHKTFRLRTSADAPPVVQENRNPTAGFTFSKLVGRTYQLDASSSSDPDAGDYIYEYNFRSSDGQLINSSSAVQTITFPQDGTYTVELTVQDKSGAISLNTASQIIVVNEGGTEQPPTTSPTATFTLSQSSGIAPLTVTLNAGASQPSQDAAVTTYNWSVSPSLAEPAGNGAIRQLSFTQPGTYTITLNITDSLGKTATTSRILEVQSAVNELNAYFTVQWLTPYRVRLDASASTAAVGQGRYIDRYQWTSSHGVQLEGMSAELELPEIGDYAVTLTVYDNALNVDAMSQKLSVISRQPPVANFTLSASEGVEPLQVQLNGRPSYDPDNMIDAGELPNGQGISAYLWTLRESSGGALTTHGAQPTLNLTEPGVYTVELMVIDDEGNPGTVISSLENEFIQVSLPAVPELPETGGLMQLQASDGSSTPVDGMARAGIQDVASRELLSPATDGINAGVIFVDNLQDVRLLASMDVLPEHQGKVAKRFAAMVLDTGDNLALYKMTHSALLPFLPWELNDFAALLPGLVEEPATVNLGETLDFELYQGQLRNSFGSYALFFGYAVDGETFVYTAAPLSFSVL